MHIRVVLVILPVGRNIYMWLSDSMCSEVEMGKLNVNVDDEIDEKFRKEVFKRKGMKKGNLTKAVQEAMLMWVTTSGSKAHTAKNEG